MHRLLTLLPLLLGVSALAYLDPRTEAYTPDAFFTLLGQHPGATLDQVPALLPEPFLANFALKHGLLFPGQRGARVETKVSQSADPNAPRTLLWDERSGFMISYNGGLATQTAPQRIDALSFDADAKVFHLFPVEFPYQAGAGVNADSHSCVQCHGPNLRPIFMMYPDWPSFYGSDNDELTDPAKPSEKAELKNYTAFRAQVSANPEKFPRYAPLLSNDRMQRLFGRAYTAFPYRFDVSTDGPAESRAFTFRPNLRLGVLLNRLQAQSIEQRLLQHDRYAEFAPFFLFNLLQCKWSARASYDKSRWPAKLQEALGEAPRLANADGLLHYRQLWKLFDLAVNDVDMRLSYNHEGYARDDATSNIMDVGYIGRYWNAYFDGTATIDELVAYRIYQDLAVKLPKLQGLVSPDGLVTKYAEKFPARFRHDEQFFREMDHKGQWLPMPYPKAVYLPHHRETYLNKFQVQYDNLCRGLEAEIK